ncbi:hypothetical protein BRDID11002_11090 [Bradyrhizobium diazoefficiens]
MAVLVELDDDELDVELVELEEKLESLLIDSGAGSICSSVAS